MDDTTSTKTVLVCLGERKRSISFPSSNPYLERLTLIEGIQNTFSDVLAGPSTGSPTFFLQVKSEEWDGEFLDLKEEDVIWGRSVIRVCTTDPKPSTVSFLLHNYSYG